MDEPAAPAAPPTEDAARVEPGVDGGSVVATPPAAVEPLVARLAFTGSGSEYFRIWVVNTVLTVLTIGIYSAWAKVRKASYFARNTVLLGDTFEFTADPVAILRGRLVALALLGFYTFAFDFSIVLGLVATTLLLALAPVFLASASRFRLQNTRWRAIRFEFTATRAQAYRAALVVVMLWVSGTVVGSFMGVTSAGICGLLVVLMLPWMHHRLKAFQHRHVRFAGYASTFRSAVGAFYGTYILASLILFGGGLVAAFLAFSPLVAARNVENKSMMYTAIVAAGLTVALSYLAMWPYFATRIQRAVWERTGLGPYTFHTSIAFRPLLFIAFKNVVLLAITAGLYWPFASIAWARYRIGCMSVAGTVPPEQALIGIDPGASRAAVGEGAADFFGMDIGW